MAEDNTFTVDTTVPTETLTDNLTPDEQDSLAVGEKIVEDQEQLLAGKYKSAEELEKAYKELEQKLGDKTEPETAETEPESEPESEPEAEPESEPEPEPPYGVEWLGDLQDYMTIENFQIAGMVMLLTIIINFVGLPLILKKRKRMKRVIARRAANAPSDLDDEFQDFFN